MYAPEFGLIPDSLETLLDAADDFRAYCAPQTLEVFDRNLPASDLRFGRQNLDFVRQRREIKGLGQYPNDVIRTVLALYSIALILRLLLERGSNHQTVGCLSAIGDILLKRLDSRHDKRASLERYPSSVFEYTIAERAIMTIGDARLVWSAFANYLRTGIRDMRFLGMFLFRTEHEVLLARSPIAIDAMLAEQHRENEFDAIAMWLLPAIISATV